MRAVLAVGALLLALALPSRADFQFGVVGDLPYSPAEREQFAAMMEEMDGRPLAFVVHAGDFKSGSSRCSDAVYRDRLALFSASRHPWIYTPGDNDWTDCHRSEAGSYEPTERLARLRSLFFPDVGALGRARLKLDRQSDGLLYREFVENARWVRDGVVFITLHIPGSNNGIVDDERPSEEFLRRAAANRVWLTEAFALARSKENRALVIAIQANPGFERAFHIRPRKAYAEFLQQIRDESASYDGQVLLVHGDTHSHRIDQPLRDASGRVIENLTRLETYGSPFMGWVRVTVSPAATKVFSFDSRPFTRPSPATGF